MTATVLWCAACVVAGAALGVVCGRIIGDWLADISDDDGRDS